jgi:hypothetical protein
MSPTVMKYECILLSAAFVKWISPATCSDFWFQPLHIMFSYVSIVSHNLYSLKQLNLTLTSAVENWQDTFLSLIFSDTNYLNNYSPFDHYPSSGFLFKSRTMDNVRKINNCTNIPSSQIYRSYLRNIFYTRYLVHRIEGVQRYIKNHQTLAWYTLDLRKIRTRRS